MLLAVTTDPMGAVERTQIVLEKGPIAAVASFFIIAFFASLFFLLRAKDKHLLTQEKMSKDHNAQLAILQKEHAEILEAVHSETRDRSIKLEIALHGMLDMMDDIRLLAFEAKRAREHKEQRSPRATSQSQTKLEAVVIPTSRKEE